MISNDDLNKLQQLCQYKNYEIEMLSLFLQPDLEFMIPTLIIEGPPSSGKTFTISKYFELLKLKYSISQYTINCEFAFTQNEIIRQIQKNILKHLNLQFSTIENKLNNVENIHGLPGSIQIMIEAFKQYNFNKNNIKPMIIIFDKIDKLSMIEQPGNLIKCLSKLHELNNIDYGWFSFIFVCTRSDFLDLGTCSIPNIRFNEYKYFEFKNILFNKLYEEFWGMIENAYKIEYNDDITNNDSENDNDNNNDNEQENDIKFNENNNENNNKLNINDNERRLFFKQFLDLIMDTYKSYIGLSMEVIIPILRRIWPIFSDNIIRTGNIIKGKNDAFSIFIKNRNLLNKEFSVVSKLENSDYSLLEYTKDKNNNNFEIEDNKIGHYDLSIKTKYLVIASFLASYNEPKFDIQFFGKGNKYNSIIKQYKKKIKINDIGAGKLRRAMSAAIPFKLERLLAILRSIWNENIGEEIELFDDVELMSEIATLSSLKTLIKLKSGDTINGQTKWKCNVHWNVVKKFSQDVNFNIENHLQE